MTFAKEVKTYLERVKEDERRRRIKMNALAWKILDGLHEHRDEQAIELAAQKHQESKAE